MDPDHIETDALGSFKDGSSSQVRGKIDVQGCTELMLYTTRVSISINLLIRTEVMKDPRNGEKYNRRGKPKSILPVPSCPY
jgi:hypothetical protein